MEVNVHHAKTNLSKLIAAVESGEEVIIARNGKPTVKLVRVTPTVRRSRRHMLGSGVGKIWMAEDAFSPVAHAEYSLDAGPWQFIDPVGNLSDSRREHYNFVVTISPDTKTTEHLITVRVYDRHDNAGAAKTVVHAPQK